MASSSNPSVIQLDSSNNSGSDADTDMNDTITTPIKKKAKISKIYKSSSTVSPAVIDALEKVKPGVFRKHSTTEVLCKECSVVIKIKRGGTKDAIKHCDTLKHARSVKANKGQMDLFQTSGVVSSKAAKQLEAEVLLCQIVAMKNIPFATTTDLTE